MDDLNLPIIKNFKSENRTLSMDEYVQFVDFNLKHTFDKTAYMKWKVMQVVNVPFSLDD